MCDIINYLFNSKYKNNVFIIINSYERLENRTFDIRRILVSYREVKINKYPLLQLYNAKNKITFIFDRYFLFIMECQYDYNNKWYKMYNISFKFLKSFKSFDELTNYLVKYGKVKEKQLGD